MGLREALYLLTLTILSSVSFGGSVCSQTNAPDLLPGSNSGGQLSTEVSVEMRIPLDRITTQMTLTFSRKGEAQDPVLAIAAFDIPVERRDVSELVRDLERGGRSSFAAFLVDSDKAREVWFGKTIGKGEQSAQLTVELPELMKPMESSKNYRLAFLPVDGDLRSVAGTSKAISQAKLAGVRLEVPEGWDVIGTNWKVINAGGTKFRYNVIVASGDIIEAQLKRAIGGVKEWLQEHIGEFFGVLLIVLGVLVTAIHRLQKIGWQMLPMKAIILIIMAFLAVYMWNDYRVGGPQGWFERNWWIISSSLAALAAFILPITWVDVVLEAVKRPGSNAVESGGA